MTTWFVPAAWFPSASSPSKTLLPLASWLPLLAGLSGIASSCRTTDWWPLHWFLEAFCLSLEQAGCRWNSQHNCTVLWFHYAQARSSEPCSAPDTDSRNRRHKLDARYRRQFFVPMGDFWRHWLASGTTLEVVRRREKLAPDAGIWRRI